MFPWLEKPWKVWLETFHSGRIPNAIIVSGADGLGKKTFARNMGNLFLCEEPKPDGYCGKCHSCLMLADGTHPDALIIGDGENSTMIIDRTCRNVTHHDDEFIKLFDKVNPPFVLNLKLS